MKQLMTELQAAIDNAGDWSISTTVGSFGINGSKSVTVCYDACGVCGGDNLNMFGL